MSSEVANINERKVVLPTWLDTLIFNDLSASYCRQNKDMVVLEWNFDDIKNIWERIFQEVMPNLLYIQ